LSVLEFVLTLEQARVVVAIAAFRKRHERGPTWSEVQRMRGFATRAEASYAIRSLFDAGLRWHRGVPYSLEVRSRLLRAALEVIGRGSS
jgi:hypothetical protein